MSKSKLFLLVVCAAIWWAPAAHADQDIYHPNAGAGWCPGGGNITEGIGAYPSINGANGYCDGEPYPDGSFWHEVPQGGLPGYGFTLQSFCRVGKGSFITSEAPPGGCGGEWTGG